MSAARFLLFVVAIFSWLGGLYFAAFSLTWSQPVEPVDPLREIYLVKSRLADETPSPRWLIVGGSSAWFGFDSGLLGAAARQGVINMGVHADLPLWFQLAQIEQKARPGDTVLLAAELVHYWRARTTTYGAVKLGALAPEMFAQAGLRRKAELLGAIPPSHVVARLIARLAGARRLTGPTADELLTHLRAQWAGTFTGEVPRSYYNYLELDQHGDFSRLRIRAEHSHEDYGLTQTHRPSAAVWHDLAGCARRLRSQGVKCLFTWQPFEQHEGFDFHSVQVQANLADLRHRLEAAGWREIGRPEDAVLASEFFYDTPYHLTTEGARQRTARLVERLREGGLLP